LGQRSPAGGGGINIGRAGANGGEDKGAALREADQPTLSRNFQLAFLQPLLDRADLQMVLRSGGPAELLAELRALNLDVVLMDRLPAVGPGPALVGHRVARQRVGLFGTPKRLREGGSLQELLARHPVIVPGPESGLRAEFEALANRLRVAPRIAAEVDDMAMMRLLARQDVGLAVMPAIVVRDELRAGTLMRATPLSGLVETFYAVTIARSFPNPLLRPLLKARSAALED
jgi:LysR family transcriptional activator of nhaA